MENGFPCNAPDFCYIEANDVEHMSSSHRSMGATSAASAAVAAGPADGAPSVTARPAMPLAIGDAQQVVPVSRARSPLTTAPLRLCLQTRPATSPG
jgi:hypothetical protein